MASIAVVGAGLSAQVLERPGDLGNVEVLACGPSADQVLRLLEGRPVDALVAELESLGEDAGEDVRKLQAATGAQVAVVVYEFARRQDLARISGAGENIRTLRKPVNLSMLQLSLMSTIVKGILKAPATRATMPATTPRVQPAPVPPAGNGHARPARFTREQLGRLQEMSSTIKCECPNHVASLVTSLLAFEDYARNCENRNAEDAAMHRLLHDKTAAARVVMEEALWELVKFEQIKL